MKLSNKVRVAAVGLGAAAVLLASTGTASASPKSWTDYTSSGCHGNLVLYGGNWAFAEGWSGSGTGCSIQLWQRNINVHDGGRVSSARSSHGERVVSPETFYHNDGVHQVMVCVYDDRGGLACSDWIY